MEPPPKQACTADLPEKVLVRLCLKRLGVDCGLGPMDLQYTLTSTCLEIKFWPDLTIEPFTALLEPLPNKVYDLYKNCYDDRLKPRDGGFYPSRAFFFFMVYIVVYRLDGTLVANKCPGAGYVLAGRPPRQVRGNEYYSRHFRLPTDCRFYIKLMTLDEYCKETLVTYKWDSNKSDGHPFRGMGDRGFEDRRAMVVLESITEETCKNRADGRRSVESNNSTWPTAGMCGQQLAPGAPLAAVGFNLCKMSCISSRAEGTVAHVRGIHSMIPKGSQLLFTLFADWLFGNSEQRQQQLAEHFPELPADVHIDAIMPDHPLHPFTAIFCTELGGLPATNDQSYILPNPDLFDGI